MWPVTQADSQELCPRRIEYGECAADHAPLTIHSPHYYLRVQRTSSSFICVKIPCFAMLWTNNRRSIDAPAARRCAKRFNAW
jgi:hypothetical protein